jgi:hypothetical protein
MVQAQNHSVRSGALQYRLRVAAAAHGEVSIDPAGTAPEQGYDLIQENRYVLLTRGFHHNAICSDWHGNQLLFRFTAVGVNG